MKRARDRLGDEAGESQLCPACDAPITADDINLAEGVALCPDCGKVIRLSELNLSGRANQQILAEPPRGCHVEPDGHGVVITASLRSVSGFLVCLALSAFWNGIVSLFASAAIAGLYFNFVGPLPAWIPLPGVEEGIPIMNDAPMGLGMTLFLCLFLTPFIVIGAVLIVVTLLNLAGRIQVVIHPDQSFVSTGIFFVRLKKRFDPNTIQSVGIGQTTWKSNDEHQPLIELKGKRPVRFGSMLTEERREWLRVILSALILDHRGSTVPANLPRLSWIQKNH